MILHTIQVIAKSPAFIEANFTVFENEVPSHIAQTRNLQLSNSLPLPVSPLPRMRSGNIHTG